VVCVWNNLDVAHCFFFQINHINFKVYINSDADEIKVTSEYAFTFGGGPVFWKSCKQTILTSSTIEAELTTLDTATVEI
jgi:hypothetical protein